MLPYMWRITKYDPALRDEQGRFVQETWTSASDVGKSFGGDILTPESYLAVESAYASVAAALAVESGEFELTMREVEQRSHDDEIWMPDLPPISAAPPLVEGGKIPVTQLGPVVRLVLRELAWLKLEASDFYLHFGYDYYMYSGSHSPCPEAMDLAGSLGLFVENMPSPYCG